MKPDEYARLKAITPQPTDATVRELAVAIMATGREQFADNAVFAQAVREACTAAGYSWVDADAFYAECARVWWQA